MKLMHSCRQVAELLTRQQDERLGWLDTTSLRLHLTMCGNCANVAQQLAQLQQLSGALFTDDAFESRDSS